MKVFSPTTWICCFDEIVGVTSPNPTLVPLIQIIDDKESNRNFLRNLLGLLFLI
jgi:hypothetical protein